MKKRQKTQQIKDAKQKRQKQKQIRLKHRKPKVKDLFKLDPVYEKFILDFNKELSILGLQLRDVGGDGNCLFRAVSDQLEGDECLYDMYRKQACRHMRQNEEFYTLYLDEDDDGNLTSYLREMGKDCEWGGNLQLQALSECFNMNIVIHRKELVQTIVQPWNQKLDKNKKRFTIHLAYFQEEEFEHYASVRLKGDKSTTEAITSLSKLPQYRHLDNNFEQIPEKYGKKVEVRKKKKTFEDYEEERLLKIQLAQLGIPYEGKESEEQEEENYFEEELKEPFPNYPRTKKCKCGSGQQYKNCCYKEYEKLKAQMYKS